LAPSDLPPPIRSSRSATARLSAYAGGLRCLPDGGAHGLTFQLSIGRPARAGSGLVIPTGCSSLTDSGSGRGEQACCSPDGMIGSGNLNFFPTIVESNLPRAVLRLFYQARPYWIHLDIPVFLLGRISPSKPMLKKASWPCHSRLLSAGLFKMTDNQI